MNMASLPDIRLDDRNWEELRDELVRRIPVHSEAWTDHNPSDPGIVLLELFAYLGENLLYRMNRAPEKARREFLNLLNIPLQTATLAKALVRFELPKGQVAPVNLPFGGSAPRTLVSAGRIEFQVSDELTVLPLETRAYVKQPVAEPATEIVGAEGMDFLLQDHYAAAGKSAPAMSSHGYYQSVPLPEVESGILPPVTAIAATLDRTLWIALLAPEPLIKGFEGGTLLSRMQQLRLAIAGKSLSIGVRVDDALCGAEDHRACPEPGSEADRLPLDWHIGTGRFNPADQPLVENIVYQRLTVVSDQTEGLTRSGVVRLQLPPAQPGGVTRFNDWAGLLDPDLLGVGELPPRLEQADDQARVLTWIRVRRPGEDSPQPRLHHLAGNTVAVEQAVTAAGELLGYGSGQTAQQVQLSKSPLLADTLLLQLREAGQWENWQQTESLTLSLPDDRHYELDLNSGVIRFGDGIHGRIPRPGEAIRCLSYRYGGGVAGNVPAEAINKIRAEGSASSLKCSNTFAASGGADGETIPDAIDRIPRWMRHRERAVAAEDFVELAQNTPGVDVGRVHVLPRHKPHERIDQVPGVVTLVIVPAYDPLHPDEPVPDQIMLRRVCEELEFRRLVTTELYVTPPQYVPLWVSVAFEIEAGYGFETVRRWIELAVRQYLAPLPPYGPAGQGWPFGRAVSAADVEAAVLKVEGVRLVAEVLLEGDEIDATGKVTTGSGKIRLHPWQLPVLRGVQVAAAENAEPIEREEPAAGGDPDQFPVPVEREEC
ncbi:MAG: putative baseplate assembly protein [Candidatus Thiodiazotropha sp.]